MGRGGLSTCFGTPAMGGIQCVHRWSHRSAWGPRKNSSVYIGGVIAVPGDLEKIPVCTSVESSRCLWTPKNSSVYIGGVIAVPVDSEKIPVCTTVESSRCLWTPKNYIGGVIAVPVDCEKFQCVQRWSHRSACGLRKIPVCTTVESSMRRHRTAGRS